MPIVPTPDDSPQSTGPKYLPPAQCYFKKNFGGEFRSKLFTFVDFGTSANSFLKACGTKGEPSVEDIVLTLLKDPKGFFDLGGRDRWNS